MEADTVRGHVDLMLLAIIKTGPTYGYALIQDVRTISDNTVALTEGTIYPALRRLSAAGYLVMVPEAVGGRRRHLYRLTDRGRLHLQDQRREWEQLIGAVNAVLDHSDAAAVRPSSES
ncbi:PadR family transcriptional regulator [Micromonospora sp.]|uniref:PadR family transcriptional regulator n=1 Tax=Micromonospora sp. TaxID=1876 RepID=UPI003B3A4BA8